MDTKYLNLTVVIPAYNVDRYLEDCVNSILTQNLLPKSIIIINDGSTDKTEEIALNLAKHNSIIKLITIKNCGMGMARNVGVKYALTDFVYFIDSDDLLLPGLFNEFNNTLHKLQKIDLFCFSGGNFIDNQQNYLITDSTFVYKNSDIFDNGRNAFKKLISSNNFFCSPVLFIFRKNILNWETDGFLDIIHEDEEWTPRLFFHSGLTVISNNKFYARRIRRGSVTFSNESINNLVGYYTAYTTLDKYKSYTNDRNLILMLTLRIQYLKNNIIKIALTNRINLFVPPFEFKILDYFTFFLKSPSYFIKLFLVGIKRIFIKNLKNKF